MRIERAVGGRPGLLGRHVRAWRCFIKSRCQRCTVSGWTSSRSRRRTWRGSGTSRSGGESPVFRSELHPVRTELPFEDGDLVAQGEDLRVLAAVAHR
ncbi:hypothetical protein Y717_14670 [Streptomyces scopuliridis RB72]|uniref:Uncharacterized protein n=1 Tax=Streptomyces scopuliridis RB72 TaxID=1440053 RepID=A0A2T7TEX2_9ACTN|nr:hypothetical protein Y717_14670 [Streptomyces scopuliridis RB72]